MLHQSKCHPVRVYVYFNNVIISLFAVWVHFYFLQERVIHLTRALHCYPIYPSVIVDNSLGLIYFTDSAHIQLTCVCVKCFSLLNGNKFELSLIKSDACSQQNSYTHFCFSFHFNFNRPFHYMQTVHLESLLSHVEDLALNDSQSFPCICAVGNEMQTFLIPFIKSQFPGVSTVQNPFNRFSFLAVEH